jgi:hypothetical protein
VAEDEGADRPADERVQASAERRCAGRDLIGNDLPAQPLMDLDD